MIDVILCNNEFLKLKKIAILAEKIKGIEEEHIYVTSASKFIQENAA